MVVVLVTGGAGFIGSHVVEGLVQEGHRVRVLDDLSSGSIDNLNQVEVDFHKGDIRDPEVVQAAISDVTLVFHHAAQVSVVESLEHPLESYQINLLGSLNVLEAARKAKVKRVILASSAAVYGDREGAVREDMPLRPKSPYASSKVAMEALAQMYSSVYELDTVCLRYFNVYGPRQSPDSPYAAVIPSFIDAILGGKSPMIHGDGRQTRDFIYVRDVVQSNILASQGEGLSGKVLNISGGRAISILQLVEVLAQILPDSTPPVFESERAGDIRESSAELDSAKQALGFRPATTLQEGLRLTVRWYNEQT
jgi:UDP-glucose 4-epimerase